MLCRLNLTVTGTLVLTSELIPWSWTLTGSLSHTYIQSNVCTWYCTSFPSCKINRWSGVLPCFYPELFRESPPDILVIQAGGDNLGLMSAHQVSSVILSFCHAYSCINEHQVWRYGSPGKINKDRKTVNASIRKAVNCFGGVVIAHPCLRFFDKTIFVPDEVHFTKIGNELFLTSIHSRTSGKFFNLYGLTAHMNENMK